MLGDSDVQTRKKKGISAIIAGILMLIIGAHGSAGSLIDILISITEEGLIPKSISFMIGSFLIALAVFGGATVIAGGLLLYLRIPSFLSKFLISLGSGVSVFNLFISIILTSPAIQPLLIAKQISTLLNIGFVYAMYLSATFFAFYALVDDFYGLLLGLISGTLINISQSIAPLIAILDLLKYVGITHPPLIVVKVLAYLFLAGIFFYAAGFLYGYKHYKLGFTVIVIGFLDLFIPLLALFIGFIYEAIKILQAIFILGGIIVGLVELHYGYIHAYK